MTPELLMGSIGTLIVFLGSFIFAPATKPQRSRAPRAEKKVPTFR